MGRSQTDEAAGMLLAAICLHKAHFSRSEGWMSDRNFDPMKKVMAHRDREEAKRQRRSDEWRANIGIGISVVALALSIIALWRAW